EGVARGAYILAEASSGTPEVVILATGSEVQLAVAARETLEADGVPTRVVSVPVLDRFLEQDQAYRDEVLPPSVRARVSVEDGRAIPCSLLIGDAVAPVSIEHYGASADDKTLYPEFGITAEAVVVAARRALTRVKG